jgi:hypothetical protein
MAAKRRSKYSTPTVPIEEPGLTLSVKSTLIAIVGDTLNETKDAIAKELVDTLHISVPKGDAQLQEVSNLLHSAKNRFNEDVGELITTENELQPSFIYYRGIFWEKLVSCTAENDLLGTLEQRIELLISLTKHCMKLYADMGT